MLKVLHVISGDLWAGAEAQAYTLISCLSQMPGIEAAAAVMNEGELTNRLRRAGVRVFVLDEQHRGSFTLLLRLRELMVEWHPNVIHTHREKENVLGALANWCAKRVPCVRTVHGGPEHHAGARGIREIRRLLIERLDRWCARHLQERIIVVSKELAARLSHALPAGKVVVIENGVDAAALMADIGPALFRTAEPDCMHIGIVGRLVHVKRIDLFLQMAASLGGSRSERPWRFHIFGEGPLRVELEEMSRRLQTARTVTFHGHRPDIAACIGSLDALVMCSDHEGLPMVALEAAALGVPLVAHAVGALREITPREFLVTEHSPAGYARGLRRALQNDGRTIAQRTAHDVLSRLSAQGNAQRVCALYEEVTCGRDARESPLPSVPQAPEE